MRVQHLDIAKARGRAAQLGLPAGGYGVVTLHRPSNVDDPATLRALVDLLHELSERLPLVFPVHPRTAGVARTMGFGDLLAPGQPRLLCLDPQSYLDNLSLVSGAAIVLTDSGGLQEETSVLGVPCLTLRENTERPVTVSIGTSRLVGNDPARIRQGFADVVEGRWPAGAPIPMWDGLAGQRVASALAEWLVT